METVTVSHYSDILCVWAYIAQARMDELESHFGGQVRLDYSFISVFGSIRARLERNWGGRGGARGYAAHVLHLRERFDHIELHPEVWLRTVPESSLPGHAFLAAVRLSEADQEEGNRRMVRVARTMRHAFFAQCRDVTARAVQLEIAEELGIARPGIEQALDRGRAYAVVSEQLDLARDHDVRVSPTLLFNEDRQRLTGNVGYRVIEANVRELLDTGDHPERASWC